MLRLSRRLLRTVLSRRRTFPSLFLLLTLCIILRPSIIHHADRLRQTHPWSFQHSVSTPFYAAPAELACLRGQDPATFPSSDEDSVASHKEPIPKIVHFIFGLRNPLTHPGAGTFDFLCYLAVRSAVVSLAPAEIRLHYTYLSTPPSADAGADPLSNVWVRRLAPYVRLVHHPPHEFDAAAQGHWQAAHASDVLRLQLLLRHGGVYLDIDAFALRPFGDLLHGHRDAVLGHEGGNRWGLCNAVLAARPGSAFIRKWLDAYHGVDLSKQWNFHSVILPKQLASADDMRAEVCTLSPDAFFWPTWTWHHVDWMHAPLSPTEAAETKRDMERNGGSLFEHQLAYHAWSQMSYDRYLKHLTPAKVKEVDTRFNLVMRRFMEPDL